MPRVKMRRTRGMRSFRKREKLLMPHCHADRPAALAERLPHAVCRRLIGDGNFCFFIE